MRHPHYRFSDLLPPAEPSTHTDRRDSYRQISGTLDEVWFASIGLFGVTNKRKRLPSRFESAVQSGESGVMKIIGRLAQAIVALSFVVVNGCAINHSPETAASDGSFALQGRVMGGQQPVSGSSFQLYAVGNTGDGSAAYPLIPAGSMTAGSSNNYYPNGSSGCAFTTGNPNSCSALPQSNSSGVFNITGDWGTCTSNQAPAAGTNPLLYIVATGGNPGSGINANFSEMAAVGLCSTVTSSTFLVIDEVTTVGSIAALYPYMSSYSAIGSATGDVQKLALAFNTATTEYMSTATGTSPGTGLPSGYYASSKEIDSLADSISACINSAGGTAGQNNACGNLFTDATPSGGTAPTDTIGAILDILENPALNVAAIYNLSPSAPPFEPTLTSAPSGWTLPIIAGSPTLPESLPATGTYTITLASTPSLAWDNNRTASPGGLNNAADEVYLCTTGSGCSGTFVASQQQFTLTTAAPGNYIITSVNNSLPLVTYGTTSPAYIDQDAEPANGDSNWTWTIVPVSTGSGYLIYNNWSTGLPVDATGGGTSVASGNALAAKTYTSGSSQVWNITPTSGSSCPATAITPEIWTSTYGWESLSSIAVPPGVEVSLSAGPTAVVGNSAWSWTGSNSFSSSTLQNNNIPLSSGANTYTLTYTNSCGTQSTLTYAVNVGQPTLTAAACDVLNTAGTPCGAAYSLTRRMFAAYTGNLFQLSCASCSPTTMNIGTSSTTGQVNVAAATSYCSTAPSSCYISQIYDQTANANNLTSASGSMALYQVSPYNGLPILQTTAPTPTTTLNYSTPSATATTAYYRDLTGTVGIPTGTPTSGISVYYVRSNYALVSTEGDFGDMDSTVANSGAGHRFAIGYSAANGVTTNTTGSYYCLDLENSTTAYNLNCGASGTAPTTSQYEPVTLPSPPLFTEIGKYTYNATLANSSVAVEMADAAQGALRTLYSAAPAQAPNLGGGVSLGEGADGKIAYTSFQEGAIIPYTITADASLQANIAAFYGQPALTNYATTGTYQGPCDVLAAAASTICSAFTSATTTSGWWGLRAYSNAYAAAGSNAIQLYRVSDGTTANIPVTATGDLNVPMAQSFCQNTICNIAQFYDQTGGGHNMILVANNEGLAARLLLNCANGVKVCASYQPYINNAQEGYQTTFSAAIPQPYTLNGVWDKTDALYNLVGAVLSGYAQANAANFGSQANEATQTYTGSAGSNTNAQPAHSYVFQSMTSEFNNTTSSPVYINGISSLFNASGTTAEGIGPGIEMGSNYTGPSNNWQPQVGFIQEAGLWSSALTPAQVSALQANQRAYWQF